MLENTESQINQCMNLLKDIFGNDLLGVYLFGSSIIGGLQKYSDIDIFVVSERATTPEDKIRLAKSLLDISGIYMKTQKRPVELMIVTKSDVNPWHYPPKFDFIYGDWLRKAFKNGNMEPWPSKEMPDLALLITQVLLASETLHGPNPDKLLCDVPYRDFMRATSEALKDLQADLENDTRNVLLTCARVWSTVETDEIRSKLSAVDWVTERLPEKYLPVMQRAKAICLDEEVEYWDDIQTLIKPCLEFMINQINKQISKTGASDDADRYIKLAN